MPTRQRVIRTIANGIFFLKKRQLRAAKLKFLVFTGTAGKTTLRDAVVHTLETMKVPVSSNKLGYSNELGILLTILRCPDFSFRDPRSIFRLIMRDVPQEGFVCIELGADFYEDIPWFLKRFSPYAVFVSGVAGESWSRDVEAVFRDRKSLLERVPESGFVLYNLDGLATATMMSRVHLLCQKRGFSLDPKLGADVVANEWSQSMFSYDRQSPERLVIQVGEKILNLIFRRPLFEPQVYAVLAVSAFVYQVFPGQIDTLPQVFEDYPFSHGRLQMFKAKNGATVIEDSYKATPLCTNWFLDMSLRIKANQRILVMTELRPLTLNAEHHYEELAQKTQQMQRVYFLGPQEHFDMLSQSNPEIKKVDTNDYTAVAQEILQNSSDGDVVLLKGSFRYKLEDLRKLLV